MTSKNPTAPATVAQMKYLNTLEGERDLEQTPSGLLNRSEASRRIDELLDTPKTKTAERKPEPVEAAAPSGVSSSLQSALQAKLGQTPGPVNVPGKGYVSPSSDDGATSLRQRAERAEQIANLRERLERLENDLAAVRARLNQLDREA